MKKLYILITVSFFSLVAYSQYAPYLYYSDGTMGAETSWNLGNEMMYDHDSILCILLNGGFQELNTNNGQWKFRFHNIYNSALLCQDTGTNIILCKGNNLYKYNYVADTLIDISPFGSGHYFHAIGRSATQTWIMADTNLLGRYNGQHWVFDSTSFNVGYHMLVQNDSTAFFLNNSKIMRWCNGAENVLTILPNFTDLSGWDIDTNGNMWIAAYQHLLRVSPSGFINIYSDTLAPFQHDQINNVFTDYNGNIWCQTLGSLYRYNGQNWTIFSIGAIAEASIDKQSGKVYAYYNPGGQFNNAVAIIDNGVITRYYLPNRPFQNIKTANPNYIATDLGIFTTNGYIGPGIIGFTDTLPFSKQVTCFENNKYTTIGNNYNYWDFQYLPDTLYGTRHGVFSVTGVPFPNNLLPDTDINFIAYCNNITYVGTNKGYCAIDSNLITYFDTSNTPLPSNKITAIAFYIDYNTTSNTYDTMICVGTDKGFALKSSSGWQTYDTAFLHVNSLYVSDIEAMPYYTDSAFWISTFGQGLIMLGSSGNFSILNTANGQLPDDSVFYINKDYFKEAWCYGENPILGTGKHGLVYQDDNSQFISDTSLTGGNFHRCQVQGLWWMGTDSGFVVAQICGGIPATVAPANQLRWHQQDNQFEIFMPDDYSGKAQFTLYDIQGQIVGNMSTTLTTGGMVTIPANSLAGGLYILQCNLQGTTLYTKLVYSR